MKSTAVMATPVQSLRQWERQGNSSVDARNHRFICAQINIGWVKAPQQGDKAIDWQLKPTSTPIRFKHESITSTIRNDHLANLNGSIISAFLLRLLALFLFFSFSLFLFFSFSLLVFWFILSFLSRLINSIFICCLLRQKQFHHPSTQRRTIHRHSWKVFERCFTPVHKLNHRQQPILLLLLNLLPNLLLNLLLLI